MIWVRRGPRDTGGPGTQDLFQFSVQKKNTLRKKKKHNKATLLEEGNSVGKRLLFSRKETLRKKGYSFRGKHSIQRNEFIFGGQNYVAFSNVLCESAVTEVGEM